MENELRTNKAGNLDILFIGGIFPKELEDIILKKSKKNVQSAANNFQWSLINGFDKNLKNPIKIMNEMFVGGYPQNYTDAIVNQNFFAHIPGAKDINLGFINISGIKQICRPFGEKKYLRNWALKSNGEKKAVIIYSLNPRFIRIAKELKKINKNIFICITINDLPNYIMMGKISLAKKMWKYINNIRVTKSLRLIDGFVLITEQMANYLEIAYKPHVVVEALIDTNKINNEVLQTVSSEYKTIVYTGTLTKKYGILDLVEAFDSIKGMDYRLVICGEGETADQVREKAAIDNRIQYMGVLKPDEIAKIQKNATVLVNPRKNIGEYTKYSFPIKTIEYLLSGPPVVCYKLDGIPSEYDEHLFYVKDNTIKSLALTLQYVCNLSQDERQMIKEKNIKFVETYKNNIIQTRKILDMIANNG